MQEKENRGKELVAFSQAQVRRVWHNGQWYYSVVDIIAVLTDSSSPRDYWSKLKNRAKTEGFEETLTIWPRCMHSLAVIVADRSQARRGAFHFFAESKGCRPKA